MWAVAEVCWQDPAGTSCREAATLEDTSASGACVRVNRPFGVGSQVIVKWHREQFSAITRNCRPDGAHFLLGVRRGPTQNLHRAAHGQALKRRPSQKTKREAVLLPPVRRKNRLASFEPSLSSANSAFARNWAPCSGPS